MKSEFSIPIHRIWCFPLAVSSASSVSNISFFHSNERKIGVSARLGRRNNAKIFEFLQSFYFPFVSSDQSQGVNRYAFGCSTYSCLLFSFLRRQPLRLNDSGYLLCNDRSVVYCSSVQLSATSAASAARFVGYIFIRLPLRLASRLIIRPIVGID